MTAVFIKFWNIQSPSPRCQALLSTLDRCCQSILPLGSEIALVCASNIAIEALHSVLQFIAMLLGSGASVFVSVGAYLLYTSSYEVPGPQFPAPTAEIWLDMAKLVSCWASVACSAGTDRMHSISRNAFRIIYSHPGAHPGLVEVLLIWVL